MENIVGPTVTRPKREISSYDLYRATYDAKNFIGATNMVVIYPEIVPQITSEERGVLERFNGKTIEELLRK